MVTSALGSQSVLSYSKVPPNVGGIEFGGEALEAAPLKSASAVVEGLVHVRSTCLKRKGVYSMQLTG